MKSFLAALATLLFATLLPPITAQVTDTSPGETSGPSLAPLRVSRGAATGDMVLTYQTACGTTDNNVYFGRLDGVAASAWSGAACGIGSSGRFEDFNPGRESYFFIVAGNDGLTEGSYGTGLTATGQPVERAAFSGNPCGETQLLTDTCGEAPADSTCNTSADCGLRQDCVLEPTTGSGACVCKAPFDGAFCETCAEGYAGEDCRSCAEGFVRGAVDLSNDDERQDPGDPSTLRCEPDVPGTCAGIECSGRGTCQVDGRFGACVCDPGYTGADCSQCAPDHQRDSADRCVLAERCRASKCGGKGECVALESGDIACECDAGFTGVDCGGADLLVATQAERPSLYDGESLILDPPPGGEPPYFWTLEDPNAPARLLPCDATAQSEDVVASTSGDGSDLQQDLQHAWTPEGRIAGSGTCQFGGAELTVIFPPGAPPKLTVVRLSVSDASGNQAFGDFLALPPSALPITGEIHAELSPYYEAMQRYMKTRGIRAGVLAISKAGKIVGSNGYGYRDAGLDADPWVHAGEGGPLVQPTSPFRLASVSKTITAAAVRGAASDAGVNINSASAFNRASRWIDDSIGFSLTSGAPPFDYNLTQPLTTDNRWANVTIQQLLNHHAGFLRDSTPPSTTGNPSYSAGLLPDTEDLQDPQQLQTARTGASSSDISYATMYAVAALGLQFDPRPTVEQMIRFTAGTQLNYNPGGSIPADTDNYSNIGYILAGRVLEGLRGETYDPDEPGVPSGWGAFSSLAQDYLCEESGITDGVYPGDAFNPQPFEPYYRDLDWQGVENRDWNIAEGGDKIRFNNGIQQWQFCQSSCPDLPGAVWNDNRNTPSTYGGFWLAERNSAGGLVASGPALLRFARNHRIRVGSPGQSNASGIGAPLANPGNHSWSSSHAGSLPGTRTLLWQMGGNRTNNVPANFGAWLEDPTAPVVMGQDGGVKIQEITFGSSCTLPGDVTVAALFNQRQDQRAPRSNVSSESTSTASGVYGRITDFLGDATCQVDSQGWPDLSEEGPVLQAPLICP